MKIRRLTMRQLSTNVKVKWMSANIGNQPATNNVGTHMIWSAN